MIIHISANLVRDISAHNVEINEEKEELSRN